MVDKMGGYWASVSEHMSVAMMALRKVMSDTQLVQLELVWAVRLDSLVELTVEDSVVWEQLLVQNHIFYELYCYFDLQNTHNPMCWQIFQSDYSTQLQ